MKKFIGLFTFALLCSTFANAHNSYNCSDKHYNLIFTTSSFAGMPLLSVTFSYKTKHFDNIKMEAVDDGTYVSASSDQTLIGFTLPQLPGNNNTDKFKMGAFYGPTHMYLDCTASTVMF